jgi:hypothetical protein
MSTIIDVKGVFMFERRKHARKQMEDFTSLRGARLQAHAKRVGLRVQYEPAGPGARERWTAIREHVVGPATELYGTAHIDMIEAWLQGYSRCMLDVGRATREH